MAAFGGLTIAQCGNFRPPTSTENELRRSLIALGHHPIALQEDEPGSWQRLLNWEGPLDLMMWTRTWHLPQMPQPEALRAMRERGVPTIGYHLDKYWGLPREQQIYEEPWWRVDWMFTADGGNDDRFAQAGIRHVWMPPAMLADNCVEGTAHKDWAADVGFIGTVNGYHPEWSHRAELVDFLARTYGHKFRHFGRGTLPLPEEYMSDAIASFKVIVGDSCNIDGRPRYWSNRIPETLGRAGFLIHPRVDGIEDWYTDGEHLCLYERGNWSELQRLIDHYVGHPAEAREIALQGQALVRSRDTFEHRLQSVLQMVMADAQNVRCRLNLENTVDEKTAWEVWDENVYVADPHIDEGCTVVDLGANVGLFTLYALEHGAARVVAVEPWPDNRTAIERNLSLSRLPGQVDIVAGAAWATTGRAGFELGEGEAAHRDAHLIPDPDGKIELLTLDDIIDGIDEVAVLKIDIEGAEYSLIEGASRDAISRCRFITMEFHRPDQAEACGWDVEAPLGRLVDKLADTHHIEVLGRTSVGGYIRALRYEEPAPATEEAA